MEILKANLFLWIFREFLSFSGILTGERYQALCETISLRESIFTFVKHFAIHTSSYHLPSYELNNSSH